MPPMSMEDARPSTRAVPLVPRLISTALGAGYMPVAPGTAGTVMAIPLAMALIPLGRIGFAIATVLVTVIGIWAAEKFVRATQLDDDQRIVIDEVAGYLVTLLLVAPRPVHLILAFFLFRIFDMWKPGPVRWLDNNVGGGFGVVIDDVGAGVVGAICLWIIDHQGWAAQLARHFPASWQ